ncbi:MAG: LysR family transcriptional regulator [Thermomicrobiales bacterium]|nr:LysR family transcriptional regulator [Thermomicrobiales bacterium]
MESDITLLQMHRFVVLAEELHFGRAAERLFMTQPPLTRQINALEAALGVPLLTRTTRRVELTRAGEAFLVEAREVIARVHSARRVARNAADGRIGTLAMGYVESMSLDVLPQVLPAFRAEFPGVELELREMHSNAMVEAVITRSLDIGIARMPIDHSGLDCEIVGQNRLAAVLWEGHPLAREIIDPQLLAEEPFITYSTALCIGVATTMFQICNDSGFVPRVTAYSQSTPELMSLVAAREGVSFVPRQLSIIPWINVRVAQLPESAATSPIAVIWRQGEGTSAHRAFREIVRKACQAWA